MEEVVLDSSVIVKAILKPYNLLPDRIYKRENLRLIGRLGF